MDVFVLVFLIKYKEGHIRNFTFNEQMQKSSIKPKLYVYILGIIQMGEKGSTKSAWSRKKGKEVVII